MARMGWAVKQVLRYQHWLFVADDWPFSVRSYLHSRYIAAVRALRAGWCSMFGLVIASSKADSVLNTVIRTTQFDVEGSN